MSLNSFGPLERQQIIAALARVQPASVIRLGTASRAMRNNTANKKSQINALKRLVRRRVARIRHFESPSQPGRPRRRLRSPLHEARLRAISYGRLTSPTRKAASRASRRVDAARQAYANYEQSGTLANWNRFVRVHAKRPGFNGSITQRQARNMYN